MMGGRENSSTRSFVVRSDFLFEEYLMIQPKIIFSSDILNIKIYQYYQAEEGFMFSDSKALVKPKQSLMFKEHPIDKPVIELNRKLTPIELDTLIDEWKNSNNQVFIKETIRLVKAQQKMRTTS
jgi:hypothetical protein